MPPSVLMKSFKDGKFVSPKYRWRCQRHGGDGRRLVDVQAVGAQTATVPNMGEKLGTWDFHDRWPRFEDILTDGACSDAC